MNIKNATPELLGSEICLSVEVEFEKENQDSTAEVTVTFNYQANADNTEILVEIINLDKLPSLTEAEQTQIIDKAINICRFNGEVEYTPNELETENLLKYGKSL